MKKLKYETPEDTLRNLHAMISYALKKMIIVRSETGIEITKSYESTIEKIIQRIVKP